MTMTLKRGFGRCFSGENWKLCGDGKWERHALYVPNGMEPFLGTRKIDGVEHAVFRCLDDDFLAQTIEVCEMPVPEDPMLVLSTERRTSGFVIRETREVSPVSMGDVQAETEPAPTFGPEPSSWLEQMED